MLVKNPFNYTGSKDRIMQQLVNNIDYSKSTFLDFFCGSGVVGVNVASRGFERVVLNDGCWQLIGVLRSIYEDETFINKVEAIIETYNLSKTDKEAFLNLREIYNSKYCQEENFDPYVLYALTMHAFNYFMIFNKNEGFSVPSGKGRSSFNDSIKHKLQLFQSEMKQHILEFYSFKMKDFIDLIKDSYTDDDIKTVTIYFDPPYSKCVSDSSVNRSYGLNWSESDDLMLMDFCRWLNAKGASFTLSNVLENKGLENKRMKEFAKEFKVIHLNDVDYSNCHFQRKNNGKSDEVIIRNF